MTTLSVVIPVEPATLMETRLAPGATPVYWPFEEAPFPAMIPATNVPWPYWSVFQLPCCHWVLRLTPSTTRPRRSERLASMPVSRTATDTPAPLMPLAHIELAPVTAPKLLDGS